MKTHSQLSLSHYPNYRMTALMSGAESLLVLMPVNKHMKHIPNVHYRITRNYRMAALMSGAESLLVLMSVNKHMKHIPTFHYRITPITALPH